MKINTNEVGPRHGHRDSTQKHPNCTSDIHSFGRRKRPSCSECSDLISTPCTNYSLPQSLPATGLSSADWQAKELPQLIERRSKLTIVFQRTHEDESTLRSVHRVIERQHNFSKLPSPDPILRACSCTRFILEFTDSIQLVEVSLFRSRRWLNERQEHSEQDGKSQSGSEAHGQPL